MLVIFDGRASDNFSSKIALRLLVGIIGLLFKEIAA
jgi:hypothetical protein